MLLLRRRVNYCMDSLNNQILNKYFAKLIMPTKNLGLKSLNAASLRIFLFFAWVHTQKLNRLINHSKAKVHILIWRCGQSWFQFLLILSLLVKLYCKKVK